MLTVTTEALMIMLKISLPPILVASAAGLLISFIQAVTQLQEQTLAFAVKLVCVMVVIMGMASWLCGELFTYSLKLYQGFGQWVR